MTPPAFARMSGTTSMPRSRRMRSAAGVVGPFAPSTMTARQHVAALPSCSTPSTAAGTSRSTSCVSRSAPSIASAPGESDDRAGRAHVVGERLDVEARRVEHGAVLVAHRGDGDARLGEEARGIRTDLAEALHGGGRARRLEAGVPERGERDVGDAAAGRARAALANRRARWACR